MEKQRRDLSPYLSQAVPQKRLIPSPITNSPREGTYTLIYHTQSHRRDLSPYLSHAVPEKRLIPEERLITLSIISSPTEETYHLIYHKEFQRDIHLSVTSSPREETYPLSTTSSPREERYPLSITNSPIEEPYPREETYPLICHKQSQRRDLPQRSMQREVFPNNTVGIKAAVTAPRASEQWSAHEGFALYQVSGILQVSYVAYSIKQGPHSVARLRGMVYIQLSRSVNEAVNCIRPPPPIPLSTPLLPEL